MIVDVIKQVLDQHASDQTNLASDTARDHIAVEIAVAIADKYDVIGKTSEPFDNYKVGDWVVLASERPLGWNYRGEMDHYLGRTVCITRIYSDVHFGFDGSDDWDFILDDIDRYASPEEISKAKELL